MGKKILLADDSITIQKVIELTFSDEDFDVITVGNGRLALEKLPEARPDIVLCDIIMPEKDGYEVCEQIKSNPAHAHIPVLLLTGAFEPFDQERAARAGYDGSLAKPFEPETLIAKVKDLLARAPARPAAAPAPQGAPLARPEPPPLPVPSPPEAPPPAAAPSFIPEEPFDNLEDATFEEPAGARPEAAAFVPMTEEESTTLSAAAPPDEAASTVMFRADDLPWGTGPAPVGEPVPAPQADEAEAPAGGEAPVFEEVLEEDLDFGTTVYVPEPADVGQDDVFARDVSTLPPIPPADDGSSTGAFVPGEDVETEGSLPPVEPARVIEPQPIVEAIPTFEPEPVLEPGLDLEPSPVESDAAHAAFEVRPPEARDYQTASLSAGSVQGEWPVLPPERPQEAHTAEPPVPPPAAVPKPPLAPPPESFGDVAAAVSAPASPPATGSSSEASALSVPVEMVEKIAQRVVAQISEKAVREIAWDVLPDLAEALIKQEIERLKTELQKT
jgi:CheY-like chemotaxis protein